MIIGIILFMIVLFYFFMVYPRRSEKRRILDISPSMFAHRGYHDIAHHVPENSMTFFTMTLKSVSAVIPEG